MIKVLDAFAAPIEHFIPKLPGAILTFLVGFVVVQILLMFFSLVLRTLRTTKALEQILEATVAVILWVGLAALVMQSLGLNQVAIALSGSFAIIGIGLASGANKLVADIVAGLFLAKNRNFKIGQRIKIDAIEGKLHSLDARKVRVLGKDGTLFVMPNAKFDDQIWHLLPEEEAKK